MKNLCLVEKTDIGARAMNQDYMGHCSGNDWSLFVLADGLGGHPHGEVAAKVFCESVLYYAKDFAYQLLVEPTSTIQALILKAHQKMRADIFGQYGVIDCHTTCVLAWVNQDKLITAHVGDSRLYRVNRQQVLMRTADHTPVQQLFEQGRIQEQDFESHPLQNRLLNTINLFSLPSPEIHVYSPLAQDETLVLCSDGFWGHVSSGDIVKIANAESVDQVKQLLSTLFENILASHPKTADNITVQVIRFQ